MNSSINYLWPWLKFSIKFFGGLFGVTLFGLYLKQDNVLYIPNPPGYPKTPADNPETFQSPSEWSTEGALMSRKRSKEAKAIPYEDLVIKTEDGENINCWLFKQQTSSGTLRKAPILVYFHGNAGNMGFRLKNAAGMYSALQAHILLVDYRGFGSSTGSPSEAGLNKDADAILEYVTNHEQLKESRVFLFGRSLGGAVAISLAERHPLQVHGLILENTFLSISAMVDKLLPKVISIFKHFILRIKWDSDRKISSLNQSILFISGDSDELVPPSHMKKLYDLASKSVHKEFYSVSGGTHNDTWIRASDYYERLAEFFKNVMARSGDTTGNGEYEPNLRHSDSETIDHLGASIPTMKDMFTVK